MRRLAPAAVLALLVATPALAQSTYDRYGDVVDVNIQSLADSPSSYDGRAVRVKGVFELGSMIGRRSYILKDNFAAQVLIYPVREIEGSFDQEALHMTGKQVEITGVFQEARAGSAGSTGVGAIAGTISFWKFTGPPEEIKGDIKAETVSLEALVSSPGRYDGKTIRVYGKFRGKNLYGDLASHSERDSHDWVMKEDVYAIWVTGRKPKGSGFELDTGMKRDTEKWLQVVGKPETIKGVTYLQALQVVLGKPSGPLVASGASSNPAPAPSATPLPPPKPPVVVFALPLDGDGEVPSNGRFQIQFSQDMEEETFKGRVLIRYRPPVRPGDRAFDGVKMTYDLGRKALTVDPGDMLRPGREVEILLLPGIFDINGVELVARQGRDGSGPQGATDLLRYKVLTASLIGAR